jgi:DNA-binding response OmpR family regulator
MTGSSKNLGTSTSPAAVSLTGTPRLDFGALVLDLASATATVDGVAMTLAPQEFRLLSFLAENADRVLSRDDILDHVWGWGHSGDPSTLSVHVLRLRAKLDRHGVGAHIRTVRGVGYIFDGTFLSS